MDTKSTVEIGTEKKKSRSTGPVKSHATSKKERGMDEEGTEPGGGETFNLSMVFVLVDGLDAMN